MNETIKIKVEFVAKNLDAVGQEVGANLLRQLAEENAKLRDSISAIQHSIAQYRVPGNDKWREVELIDEICLQALEG